MNVYVLIQEDGLRKNIVWFHFLCITLACLRQGSHRVISTLACCHLQSLCRHSEKRMNPSHIDAAAMWIKKRRPTAPNSLICYVFKSPSCALIIQEMKSHANDGKCHHHTRFLPAHKNKNITHYCAIFVSRVLCVMPGLSTNSIIKENYIYRKIKTCIKDESVNV